MKILLLNPPFFKRYSRQSRSPCVTKGGTFYYPYYLAYATGVLEAEGYDVRLIDAVARDWSREDTIKYAKEFGPDLTILDTSTPSIYNDSEVASEIKGALPHVHINLVGTHPTNLPDETIQLSASINSLCRGEYDYTLVDLANTLEEGKALSGINGLTYRDNGKIVNNKPRELIKDLDDIPFVSKVYKKHLDIKDYFYASLRYPQLTILTARGCPYNCHFCNTPFKNSYRTRTIENVVEEFEYIQKELPNVKEVMIEDETFPANKKRTLDLCNIMMERDVNLNWSCNARVNTEFETLKKMKDAGCRLLCVGFESPTQEALDGVNKKTTKNIQEEFMKNTRRLDLRVNGCFILGLPNDTKESIKETIEFAKKLNPATAQFYPLMIYPGTNAYTWAKEKGFIMTEDYSKWLDEEGLHNTNISRPGLTNVELVKLCNTARKEFYLRPSYLLSSLKEIIVHPRESKRILKSGRTFFKHLLK